MFPTSSRICGSAASLSRRLRFGAGIKGKVGEAMAHGIPVVTTMIGAEGFGLTHGFDVMIGDEAACVRARR